MMIYSIKMMINMMIFIIIIIIMMNPQYLHSQHHGTSGRCPSPKSFPQDVKRPSRASQL